MKTIPRMMGVVIVTSLSLSIAEAKLELPRVFGEGMVMQREKPARVWGWGDKGDAITVAFNGQTKMATVGDDGKWLLALDPMTANAKSQAMTVKGKKDALTFDNVLIGDVWLCSGQSNMEAAAGDIVNADLDMPLAGIPTIRCLTIPLHSSPTRLDNFPTEERNPFYVELKGVWRVSSPDGDDGEERSLQTGLSCAYMNRRRRITLPVCYRGSSGSCAPCHTATTQIVVS